MSNREKHIRNASPLSKGEGSGVRILISGGGTGGHIFPAIAIADELRYRFPDCKILFVGAKDKMEMQKVPQAGYEIKGLWISGIQRKLSWQNLIFPLKLVSSLWQSFRIIKTFKPDVVIGTGGFASGPLLQVAAMKGKPTLIQEQNSYPGITNKILGKKVQKICVAYEGLERFFPKDKIVISGNPVRQDLTDSIEKKHDALIYFDLDADKKTLLVLGGSLGAKKINQLIANELENIIEKNIQIIWQCGKLYFDDYTKFNENPNVKVFSFIDRMDLVYAAADIIISRAGASSVSELSLVGKPVIFIPSPNVAEDHQTKNASVVVAKGGAIMIKEKELKNVFNDVFEDLLANEEKQNALGRQIKKMAKPNATIDIVSEIVKLIK
ncbi:MAG: undecaprenyldiphospho-muramoylpentapeptide beta-N-acetylglucosaminyltransferase [Flavobacteriaceae bacterium]|nr:undecaprenyldiphospho-muramoylpentapeptide beta-N-acetylglucosaminyltransferase [Flavobacteriaceae bacterium]